MKGLNSFCIDQLYELRYRVYYEEAKLIELDDVIGSSVINLQAFQKKQLRDVYDHDGVSLQIGVIDINGIVAGTARLIINKGQGMPITQHGQITGEQPSSSWAEVSRLAISKVYRQRVSDGLTGLESYEKPDPKGQRVRHEISYEIYKKMYQLSVENGITHWCAAMERSLLRLLKRCCKVEFEVRGDEFEYWGKVYPCVLDLKKAKRQMEEKDNQLFNFFCLDES